VVSVFLRVVICCERIKAKNAGLYHEVFILVKKKGGILVRIDILPKRVVWLSQRTYIYKCNEDMINLSLIKMTVLYNMIEFCWGNVRARTALYGPDEKECRSQ